MIILKRNEVLAQKETPFAGRKPEDAIFGGVPFFIYYISHRFVRQVLLGIFSEIFYEYRASDSLR